MNEESIIEERRFQLEIIKLQMKSQDQITILASIWAISFALISSASKISNAYLSYFTIGLAIICIWYSGYGIYKPKLKERNTKLGELETQFIIKPH